MRLSLERQSLGPHVLAELVHQPRQQAAAAANVDVSWQNLPPGKLAQAEGEALKEHLDVGLKKLAHRVLLIGRQQALRVTELPCLGFVVAQPQLRRQPPGESLAAEAEHSRPLHPASAEQRHVRSPASDVDEYATQLPGLVPRTRASQRIRLGYRTRDLEIELSGQDLQPRDLRHRRERIEHRDLQVAALEADGVGDGIAVDADLGDRRMDQPDLAHLAVGSLELQQVLSLAQGSFLDQLQHVAQLGLADSLDRPLPGIGDRRREALHHLTGDAHHDLARNGPGHVLGGLERPVASVDYQLDVPDRAPDHGVGVLRLPADAQHIAVGRLPPDHESLDEVGSDVQRCEVPVVVVATLEESELGHLRVASSSLNAWTAGLVSLPWASSGLPPPRPRSGASPVAGCWPARSLETLITKFESFATATTPLPPSASRYRSA